MANRDLLALRSSKDTEGDVAALLAKLEASGSNLTILRYLANAPAQFRPFVSFANALLNKCTLPRTTVEIVVLRVGARLDLPYEVAEHVPMAERAGVGLATIKAITSGDIEAAELDHDETLALGVADALLDGGRIPDGMWRDAVDAFGEAGAVELLLVVGWFSGLVRTVLQGLDLEAPAR